MPRRDGHVQRRPDVQFLGPRGGPFGLGDDARDPHALQHHLLPRHGALAVGHWIGVMRVLRQAGEQGGLCDAQALQRLAEVGLRGGGKAIGALAQEDLVEVDLQDAVLGQGLLHLQRQQDLLGLALGREALGQQHGAHQLLREGGGPLLHAARHHRQHGARHAFRIDAVVLPKARVFHRQHGVLQALGDARQRHVDAPLGAELGDLHAVGRHHLQRQPRLVLHDAVDGRQLEGGLGLGRSGPQAQGQTRQTGGAGKRHWTDYRDRGLRPRAGRRFSGERFSGLGSRGIGAGQVSRRFLRVFTANGLWRA